MLWLGRGLGVITSLQRIRLHVASCARWGDPSDPMENSTIKDVTPQMEFTPLLVLNQLNKQNEQEENLHPERQGGGRKCGSDGIRTRDLGLDRAAC